MATASLAGTKATHVRHSSAILPLKAGQTKTSKSSGPLTGKVLCSARTATFLWSEFRDVGTFSAGECPAAHNSCDSNATRSSRGCAIAMFGGRFLGFLYKEV